MIKIKLNEAESPAIYVDDDTGDRYIFDGSQLVLWKKGNRGQIGYQGDNPTEYSPEDFGETEDEYQERIKGIKAELEDPDFKSKISREAQRHIETAAEKKAQKEDERRRRAMFGNGVNKLKLDMRALLKTQVERVRVDSKSRQHKNYQDSDFVIPGRKRADRFKKPSITFYFDRSGSWDESMLEEGRNILSGIEREFVRTGQVELKVKYFSNDIGDSYNWPGAERGTQGDPIALDIISTKPDNVFIMTDSDISSMSKYAEVPGVVWYLFKDGRSSALPSHIRGKGGTKIYDI